MGFTRSARSPPSCTPQIAKITWEHLRSGFVSLYLRFAVFDEARLWGIDGQLRSQVAFRDVQKPQIANERNKTDSHHETPKDLNTLPSQHAL